MSQFSSSVCFQSLRVKGSLTVITAPAVVTFDTLSLSFSQPVSKDSKQAVQLDVFHCNKLSVGTYWCCGVPVTM